MSRTHAGIRFAVVATLLAAACNSTERVPGAVPAEDPPELALRQVSSSPDEVSYALSLDRPGALVVGSYRVKVNYDSTRLAFVRIVAPDSMLAASNNLGTGVMVAGAAPAGFTSGPWVTVVFRPLGTSPAPSPSVEVFEVADVDGRDIRPIIVQGAVRPSGARQ